jgi:hypothetical protein
VERAHPLPCLKNRRGHRQGFHVSRRANLFLRGNCPNTPILAVVLS